MISYLKNTEEYKMEFFKGKTYDEILPIFQARFDANLMFLFKSREEIEKEDEEITKSINETPTQKAAKRRKLSEEAQEADDLKKRLEIVQDEDDDVFVEATPLAQKRRSGDFMKNRGYMEKSKECSWFGIGEKMKAADFMWCALIILSTVQLFLLVGRMYPLSRFTLEQLVNVARLQVKEKSEISLELLRFTRQQLKEYQQG
nr:hypothetical protein [Tanacetum cinerariifolium]